MCVLGIPGRDTDRQEFQIIRTSIKNLVNLTRRDQAGFSGGERNFTPVDDEARLTAEDIVAFFAYLMAMRARGFSGGYVDVRKAVRLCSAVILGATDQFVNHLTMRCGERMEVFCFRKFGRVHRQESTTIQCACQTSAIAVPFRIGYNLR